jgi:hypothetical protein
VAGGAGAGVSARVRLASGLLCVALALGGCAGLGSDVDVPDHVDGPSLLSADDVQRQPAGSPQRTLFEWWRALQFDDAPEAAKYYASDLHMTAAKLDDILVIGSGILGLNARPRLVEVDPSGDTAAVRVLLETSDKEPNGRVDKKQTARAFYLVREAGTWKMADNRYLGRSADRIARLAAEARRRQQQGG